MKLKMPALDIFEREFESNIFTFQISALKFVKNEFSTHKVNFCCRSAFSEGQDPCLGRLYKVYHQNK